MATKRRLYHIGIVGSYGGLNLGDEAILQSIVQQIRASVKARITVFSRDAEDTRQRHAIDAAVPTRNLKGEYTPGQLMTLISRFSFAVGMRLHFMIFSALQHVPFVALPYAAKVGGFLDQIGIATPPLELVNAGRLIAHIDRSWDRRRSLIRQIEHALPALQASARHTHELMLSLLRARE